MFDTIKQKYKHYKEQRFLKQHGCKNWEQYNRKYDPDYNIRATRVADIYHGYPYVYCFENQKHQIYWWDLGYNGSTEIWLWCEQNLKNKFRLDEFRVIKYNNEWEINGIGGGDFIFAAFKDERDYAYFLLRWS